ncbi:T9SS type A sorting domain-containing protein [Runella zeae]|uniref:T9SS type A sorting domain-containing protein n=1 Tax=Runella zeae TaxID=94255 RepID=UPI002353D845|nr:T9SS type A sorting domain-containing protein [Runella zeae]
MIFSSTRIFCLWGLLFAVNLLYASPYNTKRVTNKKHVAASAADTLYIWTGAVNTDWNNQNNWLVDGSVPAAPPTFGSTQGKYTKIPALSNNNYPEINSSSGARALLIEEDAKVTILSGGILKVVGSATDGVQNYGLITNNGSMEVDSAYNDGVLNYAGASIVNTATFTINNGLGNRLENYGYINNSGTFEAKGGIEVSFINHPNARLINTQSFTSRGGANGALENEGKIDNYQQFSLVGGYLGIVCINLDTLYNHTGGTFSINGGRQSLLDNAKYIKNEGTMNISRTGNTDANVYAIINREGASIYNTLSATLTNSSFTQAGFENSGYIKNEGTWTLRDMGGSAQLLKNTSQGEIRNEGSWVVSNTSGNGVRNEGKISNGPSSSLSLSDMSTNQSIRNYGTFLSEAGCHLTMSGMGSSSIINYEGATFCNECSTTVGSLSGPVFENYGRMKHTKGSVTIESALSSLLRNEGYCYLNIEINNPDGSGMSTVIANTDSLILGPDTYINFTNSARTLRILNNYSTGYVYSEARIEVFDQMNTAIQNDGKMILAASSHIKTVALGAPITNGGELLNQGTILLDKAMTGFSNTGTFTNEGHINVNRFGSYSLNNTGTFTNKGHFETGNSTKGIFNDGGIIENQNVMEIDSVFENAISQQGANSTFTNTTTGKIYIDFVFQNGIKNDAGSFVNNGEIYVAQSDTVALAGVENSGTFENNKLIRIGGTGKIGMGIKNLGTFNNKAQSSLYLKSATGLGIENQGGAFDNQACAYIESEQAIVNTSGTFTNGGIIRKLNDAIVQASSIGTNTGNVVNEDSDTFTFAGSNAPLLVSISSSDDALCINSSRTLTATPSGGSFSITGPGTLVDNQLTATGAGTIQITYTFVSAEGCQFPPIQQTIEVPALPIITNVAVTQPNCGTTGSIVVTATGTGTIEYSKDNGANWQASSTFSNLSGGSYQVKARFVGEEVCIVSYVSNPVVLQNSGSLSIFNVTGGGIICAGSGGNAPGAAVVLSGSQVGVNYQLKRGATNVGNAVAGTGNILVFSNQTVAGEYSVVAMSLGGECMETMNNSVTISTGTTPTTYTLTGGGSYCAGGAGVAIGMSNSQAGVNYQLRRSNANIGSPVAGSGSAISFGNQTLAGTYTVVATQVSSGCTRNMSGSKSVIVSNCAGREGIADWSNQDSFFDGKNWAVVSPNPVANQNLMLELRGVAGQLVKWQLVSLQGNVLKQHQMQVPSNLHRQEINVSTYSVGTYVLKVETETQKANLKVLKIE